MRVDRPGIGAAPADIGSPPDRPCGVFVVTDPEDARALASIAWTLATGGRAAGGDRARFPGASPVSVDSESLPELAKTRYVVSDKTDGVRMALLCCAFGGVDACVLLDRTMDRAWLCPLRAVPTAAFQGTVLDGELAFDAAAGRWTFLVFDAPCVSGVRLADAGYLARLDAVRRAWAAYSACESDPVVVAVKTPRPPGAPAGDGGAFDADGLVFTPADRHPLVFGRDPRTFKLKQHHTVDFVVGARGDLSVWDAATKKHVKVGKLVVDGADAPPKGAVVECEPVSSKTKTPQWRLVRVRTDKTTANDTLTWTKTVRNAAEALTVADVVSVAARAWS